LSSLGKKLDDHYRRLGERGLLLALFIAALCLNVVFSLRMNLPSLLRDEFDTAAWSAYFSGYGYSGDGSQSWLTGALYTPFYYFFDNPVIRYRSMLILNGVLASLIPLMTYKIAASLGVQKAWQKTLCAIIAGIGTAVFAYTKFIRTETLCVFFPFLLFLLLVKSSGVKNRLLRFLLSVFIAFVLAFAPAADSRLWLLVLAFIITALYSRFVLRLKTISFLGFLPAFAVFTTLQVYVSERLFATATGSAPFTREIEFVPGGFENFIDGIYHLAVSTWGVGILGICLCFFLFASEKPKNRSGELLRTFAFFALFYNAFMLIIPVDSERSVDSASPLLIILSLSFVFIHGLDFNKLLTSAAVLGIIFALPFVPATLEEVSAVFCLFALLFVLVCCAERYRSHMISLSFFVVALFSGFNTAFVFLPHEAARTEQENAAAKAISVQVYNSADAPPTYIIGNHELAPILRFLNRNTTINTAEHKSELPEDCFVIMINEKNELIFTAKGERAEAYALSQE